MARNKQPKGLKRDAPKKAQVMGLYTRSGDCTRVNIGKRPRLVDDEGSEESSRARSGGPAARSGRRATHRAPPRSQSPLSHVSSSSEEEQHRQHGEEPEEEGQRTRGRSQRRGQRTCLHNPYLS